VSKTLGQLDPRFQGFASLSFLPSRVVLQSIQRGFFCLLSCPRSIFLVDLSSSISSSNDLLSLTSLHLFFSSAHFDPVSVTVSSTQFTFLLFCLDLRLLPYPRANRPPTLTCDSSRGTSDLTSCFLRLRTVQGSLCFLLDSSLPCADCLFCVWYPVSTAPGT
jgi:hypothetical protein